MNEEINWDDAPEGFDLHINLRKGSYINSFAKKVSEGTAQLLGNGYIVSTILCELEGVVTERPPRERTFPNRRRLLTRATLSYRKPSAQFILFNGE